MKKLGTLVLVVVLLVLATSVAVAEQPPGVKAAFRQEGDYCQAISSDFTYLGTYFVQHSNGAKGHSTYKCKLEFIEGSPVYYYNEWSSSGCDWTLSLEGKKGMLTKQCFGDWYP